VEIRDALQKEFVESISTLVAGALALTVGAALTVFWNIRQKQRELDLSTAESFHALYGEFFAIWKLWNYLLADPCDERRRWELLTRACAAESGIEAILGKLAAQRCLSDEAQRDLARFRQGFQTLRQRIRDREKLDWGHSTHPQYVAFKDLASRVAALIHSGGGRPTRAATKRARNWGEITSSEFEGTWWNEPSVQQDDGGAAPLA
jgi:hypothetical protein